MIFLYTHIHASHRSVQIYFHSFRASHSVRFETMCAPCSRYSARVTHSDLNVAREAKMDLLGFCLLCDCLLVGHPCDQCASLSPTIATTATIDPNIHAPADPGGVLALGRRRYPDLDVARGQPAHLVKEAIAEAWT
jgi:hypothetical protein